MLVKVKYPPGCLAKTKTVKVDEQQQISVCIDEIVRSGKVTFTSGFVLFVASAQADAPPLWLNESSKFGAYPFKSNIDLLELKTRYQLVSVLDKKQQRHLVLCNLLEPVGSLLPGAARRFRLSQPPSDLRLYHNGKELNLRENLLAQLPSVDVPLQLRVKGDAPAPSAPQVRVVKEGEVQRQTSKKLWETRWICVKEDASCYMYLSRSDKVPIKVIDLESIVALPVSSSSDKSDKSGGGHAFTLEQRNVSGKGSSEGDGEQHLLRCVSQADVSSWLRAFAEAKIAAPKAGRLKTGAAVFGAPLGESVPAVVDMCVKYLESKALNTVGIFRLSGSATVIQNYKKAFDKGEVPDLNAETDPHAVSGLLKLYFRELPEPLMTFERYNKFMASAQLEGRALQLRACRQLLDSLPAATLATLSVLVGLLRKVTEHAETNKMPLHNLATIFGPVLFRAGDDMIQMVEDSPTVNALMMSLISEYAFLFERKPLGDPDAIIALALYDYVAQNAEELDLTAGAVVRVQRQGEAWSFGEIDARMGRFPTSYVKPFARAGKKQFMNELLQLRKQVADEEKAVSLLDTEHIALEDSLTSLQRSVTQHDADVAALRDRLKKLLSQGASPLGDFNRALNDFHGRLEAYQRQTTEVEQVRRQLEKAQDVLLVQLHAEDRKEKIKAKEREKLRATITKVEAIRVKMQGDVMVRQDAAQKREDMFFATKQLKASC